ncbi:MAG: hypothetical protein GOU99_01495 [Candidatus Altiarchaeota archaeon]|nr:hypothetical protein [Candidatus Altiarchaeota archaeon]
MVKNGFVFRKKDGTELAQAGNMREFKKLLETAELGSILYHANQGDFANWLEYMGKPGQAKKIRSIKGRDEKTRKRLIAAMSPAKTKSVKKIKKTKKKK